MNTPNQAGVRLAFAITILACIGLAPGCCTRRSSNSKIPETIFEPTASTPVPNDGGDIEDFKTDSLSSSVFGVPVGTVARTRKFQCPEYVFRDIDGTNYARVKGTISLVLFNRRDPENPNPGNPTCLMLFTAEQESFGYKQLIAVNDDYPPFMPPPPKRPELYGCLSNKRNKVLCLKIEKTWAKCEKPKRTFSALAEVDPFIFQLADLKASIDASRVYWWQCAAPFPRTQGTQFILDGSE
jgi:hypothetical protein